MGHAPEVSPQGFVQLADSLRLHGFMRSYEGSYEDCVDHGVFRSGADDLGHEEA